MFKKYLYFENLIEWTLKINLANP